MEDQKNDQVETSQNSVAEAQKNDQEDFKKILEEEEKKQEARKGFQARHKKLAVDESVVTESSEDLAEKVASKLFPKLQAQNEQIVRQQRIKEVSKGNPDYQKLIEFHLNNSVNPDLPFEDRLEVAIAVANKNRVEKTANEINIAHQNRAQVSNVSQGSSSESKMTPGNNVLSESQLNELKKRAKEYGFNEKQTKKFIEDAENKLARK